MTKWLTIGGGILVALSAPLAYFVHRGERIMGQTPRQQAALFKKMAAACQVTSGRQSTYIASLETALRSRQLQLPPKPAGMP